MEKNEKEFLYEKLEEFLLEEDKADKWIKCSSFVTGYFGLITAIIFMRHDDNFTKFISSVTPFAVSFTGFATLVASILSKIGFRQEIKKIYEELGWNNEAKVKKYENK